MQLALPVAAILRRIAGDELSQVSVWGGLDDLRSALVSHYDRADALVADINQLMTERESRVLGAIDAAARGHYDRERQIEAAVLELRASLEAPHRTSSRSARPLRHEIVRADDIGI